LKLPKPNKEDGQQRGARLPPSHPQLPNLRHLAQTALRVQNKKNDNTNQPEHEGAQPLLCSDKNEQCNGPGLNFNRAAWWRILNLQLAKKLKFRGANPNYPNAS